MTDIVKLNECIENSGLKTSFIAESLGLSRQGLRNKTTGKTEFFGSEIVKLSTLLQLSNKERESIFFASIVDK